MTTEALLALSTAPDRGQALAIARTLIEERLAACVNVLPGARSLYRWQGAVVEDEECVLLIKTSRARWEALVARLKAIHPYQVPELIAFPVERGLPAYLAWVAESTEEPT
jgi:periplasmic divalent cation tolerance protein